jgi:hypothetical protein
MWAEVAEAPRYSATKQEMVEAAESNPHGPCGPTDFRTGYGFRRPAWAQGQASLRSGLYLSLTSRR